MEDPVQVPSVNPVQKVHPAERGSAKAAGVTTVQTQVRAVHPVPLVVVHLHPVHLLRAAVHLIAFLPAVHPLRAVRLTEDLPTVEAVPVAAAVEAVAEEAIPVAEAVHPAVVPEVVDVLPAVAEDKFII